MTDIEKVISDLEKLCNGKSGNVPFVCYDALELLKEKQPIVRCVNCISRIPAKDPDCTVCNNPKSPCYQREIRDSDFCAWGKDGEQE